MSEEALLENADQKAPVRVFISYSWTTPDYEDQVLEIAKRLRSDGVDVVLDKWDLKEGHDAHAFMERMVTDPTIRKVVLLCDPAYARKADARDGGVGTETQIISKDVYGKVSQDKFIPIIMERSDGKPVLPAFLGSRKYIDFSTQQRYLENYDQLLRTIYEKPLHVKPPLGKRPTHLDEQPLLGGHLRPLVEEHANLLIRGNAFGASAVFRRLLEKTLEAIDSIVISSVPEGKQIYDLVRDALPAFVQYRDDYVDALLEYAAAHEEESAYGVLHEFLEGLFRKMPRGSQGGKTRDAVMVVALELLLYTIATLVKKGRYTSVNYLLTAPYITIRDEQNISVRPWDYRFHAASLEHDWNIALSKNRISVMADMLKERATHRKITFSEIAQAELITYLRATAEGEWWFPRLLMFLDGYGPMEVFLRARSEAVLKKLLPMLGVDSKEDLISKLKEGLKKHPQKPEAFWNFPQQLDSLLDLKNLGTLP